VSAVSAVSLDGAPSVSLCFSLHGTTTTTETTACLCLVVVVVVVDAAAVEPSQTGSNRSGWLLLAAKVCRVVAVVVAAVVAVSV